MAENVTRCPKCDTSFRISDSHLNSAKGAVRCGSCLNIFRAKDHLVSISKPQTQKTELNSENNLNEESAVNTDEHRDNAFVDEQHSGGEKFGKINDTQFVEARDEKEDGLFGGDINPDLLNTSSNRSSASEDDFGLFEREGEKDDENDFADQDESWALDLLDSSDDDELESAEKPAESSLPQPDEVTSDSSSQQAESATEPENNLESHDDLKSLFEEPQVSNYDNEFSAQENEFDAGDYQLEDESDDWGTEKETHVANSKAAYLEAIEPEPVEFDWQKNTQFWQSRSLWGGLSLLALVGIFFQVAWLNFDTYSLIQPYRAYYGEACQLLDCKLPTPLDRSKIKTANLVVRSHPTHQQALIMDAVLQNTARFEQPFPTIDIIFTDINEKIVAARRLEPKEYLRGELSGRRNMPVRQPIHIAIEMVDPGQQATGYKIAIAN